MFVKRSIHHSGSIAEMWISSPKIASFGESFNSKRMENRSRPHDRRNSVRLGATCPCAHTRFDDEGEPFDQRPSESVNLSFEGVALQSRFPVDPGEVLKVTMALGENLISFRGKVIYVNLAKDTGFQIGISIRDMQKMDKIALTRFIYYFNPAKTQ